MAQATSGVREGRSGREVVELFAESQPNRTVVCFGSSFISLIFPMTLEVAV
jgi:hypothetical protein